MPEAERIAVFDNDGTLWTEMPIPVQALFVKDRLNALAPGHPEWQQQEPFTSALASDMKGVMATGLKGIAELVMATHAGMMTDEFAAIVREWLQSDTHPTVGRPYTAMVFQPMLELLRYLRARGFLTFIVSGGGIEFMRVFAEETYGVPPHQVVGSSNTTHFEMRGPMPESGLPLTAQRADTPHWLSRCGPGSRPPARHLAALPADAHRERSEAGHSRAGRWPLMTADQRPWPRERSAATTPRSAPRRAARRRRV